MPSSDEIGNRGESIFRLLITDYPPGEGPLFSPHFLGDKFPTIDFYVELLGLPEGRVAYFFAPIKSTTRGFTSRPPERLRVKVGPRAIGRMLAYPAPTYVFGVDAPPGRRNAFFASVDGAALGGIRGIPTRHPLDLASSPILWREVDEYWRNNRGVLKGSAFSIEEQS